MRKSMKRVISLILLVAMLISCANLTWAADALSERRAKSVSSDRVTLGQIMAKNYDYLTEKERDVLSSSALIGGSWAVNAPTDDSKLIDIETETKTVTAKVYTDDEGNTWIPTSAKVTYNNADGAAADPVEFDLSENGNGLYTGEFECPSDRYRVEIEYTFYINADIAEQKTLVNAPAGLTGGVELIDALLTLKTDLNMIGRHSDKLKMLIDGVPTGLGNTIKYDPGTKQYEAIKNICDEVAQNGGKLKLAVLLENASKDAELQSMLTSADELKAEAKKLWKNTFNIIFDKKLLNDVKIFAGYNADLKAKAEQLEQAYTFMDGVDAALHSVVHDAVDYEQKKISVEGIPRDVAADVCATDENSSWQRFEDSKASLKAGMTDAELAELNSKVSAAGDVNYYEAPELREQLAVATATVSAGVDQYKVNVTVKANVVDAASVDTADTIQLPEAKTATLVLDKDTSAADILAAIENSGVKADAIDTWIRLYDIYNINEGSTTIES